MKVSKLASLLPCVLATAAALATPAHAQSTFQIKVLTAGSSAQYGVFAEAAYKLAEHEGNAKHYTVKSSQCSSPVCAYLVDSRNSNIPNEPANLWVVWSATTGDIWAYASVDSVVGVRAFMAAPRATLGLNSTLPLSATTNLPVWDDTSNDTALPAGALSAITGASLTAANTDIRPEDGLYATVRDLHTLDVNEYTGFGYLNPAISSGSCNIGYSYSDVFSSGIATAVSFALSGNDPCSHKATVPFSTIPVGAAPIVIIANTSDASGLGSPAITGLNVTRYGLNRAYQLWSGSICNATPVGGSASVPVYPIQREPTSGTYNTFEFTNIRIASNGHIHSQENNVGTNQASPNNPLDNLACTLGGGGRYRAIGTGDMVKAVNTTPDAIGYAFFSYEALPPSDTNLKYLVVDGVDPLHSTYFHGALPTCGTSTRINCSLPPGASFAHLRDGTYRTWSIYRVVTDVSGTANNTNANTLVSEAQSIVDNVLPDFVPFAPVCGSSPSEDEPGLKVYRQHYLQEGLGPNDGALQPAVSCTTGGARSLPYGALGGDDATYTEAGGDVGGAIVYTSTGSPTPPGPTGTIQ